MKFQCNININELNLQVKSGTIFDNFLISDDIEEAKAAADKIMAETVVGEKKMKEAHDEEEKKKAEEAAAAADADSEDDEEPEVN